MICLPKPLVGRTFAVVPVKSSGNGCRLTGENPASINLRASCLEGAGASTTTRYAR